MQDFSHIQSLSGHEHRVMAILVVDDTSQPICISGDSGSGICIWTISTSIGKEPLKKWYEHNDWRYSGIHSLAVSATGFLYSGSGDKSIKAWSLQVIFFKYDCMLLVFRCSSFPVDRSFYICILDSENKWNVFYLSKTKFYLRIQIFISY